jgi:hypothetical protein
MNGESSPAPVITEETDLMGVGGRDDPLGGLFGTCAVAQSPETFTGTNINITAKPQENV